jgi:VanZ family protein
MIQNSEIVAAGARMLPAVGWMALIFFLSSQEEVPTAGGLSADVQAIVGHLVLYGVLALFVAYGLDRFRERFRYFGAMVVAFAVLYGITDEIHQSFVPGRRADPFDVIVDGIGAALAITILSRVRAWRRAAE